jgi:hypothetical protein
MKKHHSRNPIKLPWLYRSHGIRLQSWKCGRYVRYWRSDVLAWMAAQEAATAKGGVQ